jgi:exopolyphosphatase/guanosine-5'-triphosphate,3'-diphosphate pyrophosphatase
MVRAVIDVGTNSVKLLVAEVAGSAIRPLHEASRVTRLGRGFYETHQLQPDAIAQTAAAVGEFARAARTHGAASLRVIATSAARDARNAAELAAALRAAAQVEVEIITGEQEADWVFRGVTTDARLAGAPLLIMDVGGGSTEFIVGEDGRCQFRRSFQLGVVRELERLRPGDPPSPADLAAGREHARSFLAAQVTPAVNAELDWHERSRVVFVGVGGSATVLAAMELGLGEFDRERLEGFILARAAVTQRTEHLWALPLAERQRVPGLPAKRADVILAGAVIYEAVMAAFGFAECRVSTRGLRYAAALEAR